MEASGLDPSEAGFEDGPSSNSTSDRVREAKARKALASLGSGGAKKSDDTDEDEKESADTAAAKRDGDTDGEDQEDDANDEEAVTTLLEQAAALKQKREALSESERAALARKEEEERILREASQVQTNALQAASELAKGVSYRESLPTSWRCPRKILAEGEESWKKIRDKWHILVEGDDVPPPIRSFADMKFPQPILDDLASRNIKRPTPIQMQGLPVALAGRDMVGIAFMGSGKSLTFALPLVMASLEEEIRMPLVGGEGPVGIILAPSRELVRQTYDIVKGFCEAMGRSGQYPPLRAQLVIGGESAREQLEPIREKGCHCIVASPGRLRDFLKKKSITLDICRYICLDEADRMLDLGFDEEVGEIMNHFTHQRQTLLFSATFPKKIC